MSSVEIQPDDNPLLGPGPSLDPLVDAEHDATPAASDEDQAARDRDQAARDRDQEASDRDQAASGEDQAASDGDQSASDADQRASDRDQAAADRHQETAGDSSPGSVGLRAFALNRAAREASTHERRVNADARHATAAGRALVADGRDDAARARDEIARRRDATAIRRDAAAEARDFAGETDLPEVEPKLASGHLSRAAADRRRAAADRELAARDRAAAVLEREAAAVDRANAARDRDLATTDSLTGTRSRGAGLVYLQHEIDRARRNDGSLVLAFVDVDELKAVNDEQGHQAGDDLLRDVGSALRDGLRSYDLVTRYGGDEFLCALSGLDLEAARSRFESVVERLAAVPGDRSVSTGFAELRDGDDIERLISRADEALLTAKRERRAPAARERGAAART